MAGILLEKVGHRYGKTMPFALEVADIEFKDGQTYALLGPSGCGKTTMLNIISGLLRPSDGRVILGGADVTNVRPEKRNIAQVFQFPVIYQTKSVFDNLAFPLECRGWLAADIKRRVEETAEILGLSGRLRQSARNLTADEKQLVSLGRGIVREDVAALLMDEPLTVIDPQAKFDLRKRIKQANVRTRNTLIYVTHDQNEAMTFADEVLVMSHGRLVQRGTPEDLFERPLNSYVGNFIGSPGMNFVPVEVSGGKFVCNSTVIERRQSLPDGTTGAAIGIRPEYVRFARPGESGLKGELISRQDQGSTIVLAYDCSGTTIRMKVKRSQAAETGSRSLMLPAEKSRLYVNDALVEG